jgi:tetratricopeptide (TPR) repeat protein
MTNEELRQRAEDIGDSALDFDTAAERRSFIERACGADESLQGLVAEYISGADSVTLDPVIRERTPVSFENRQIGPWKLLYALGEGGFGVVYLAERHDGQVRQPGAIKFLKGTVHGRDLQLRFLDERQILANLNHPGIVRLIDAGLMPEGQAYLVMEYIEDALAVDVYCRERGLPVRERVVLFRKVCEAVEYAHRKLVVHRDLKPGNILVTSDGNPRLLDFGVAKILDASHRAGAQAASSTNVLVGTERYFSPEQARREPVDTATDVYSLGVILYELLAGVSPYDFERHAKLTIEQIICTVDPEPPSRARGSPNPERVRRQLKGDLDRIVLMALRKAPQRRYSSVALFSEDLRRYIEGLPVMARADTLGYRAGKFAQRHKAGVAAAALIALSLIAGLTATIWEAKRATAAQAKAERRFKDVRRLANSYLFEFHDEIAKLPGSTAARALVVRRAQEYLGSLSKESAGDSELQEELATAYEKVGDAQGRPGFANLGNRTGALASYRQALEIRESLAARGGNGLKLQRDLAGNYERIGDELLIGGEPGKALENYRKAYALRGKMPQEDRDARRGLATSCQRMVQALVQIGQLKEARELQRRALELYEELASSAPGDAGAQRDRFISYVKAGDVLVAGSDKAGALRYYRQALPVAEAVEAMASNPARARRETASVHDKIGNLQAATNDPGGALQSYRAALAMRTRLAAADANNAETARDLSISHEKIGNLIARKGDRAGALAEYRESLKIDSKLLAADPDNAQARLDCASSHEKIGEMLLKSGDLAGALASANQARELREGVAAKDPNNLDARADLLHNDEELATIHGLMAKKGGDRESAQAACHDWERVLQLGQELERHGALDAASAADVQEARVGAARCGSP